MKTKSLLMIGVGAVVLYFVWQKFGKNSSGSSNGEEKAMAGGCKDCYCMGTYIGCMKPRKCGRMCRKATVVNIN